MFRNLYNILPKIGFSILFTFLFIPNAISENTKETDLKIEYGKHNDYDRFVFEYKNKPKYTISGDEFVTMIKFSDKNFISEDEKNIDKYPRNGLLEKRTLEDGVYYIIPAPKIKDFEYQNKIVIDVKSYKNIVESPKQPSYKETKTLTNTNDDNSLYFVWKHDVGLAAFEKDGNLWLVFDTPSEQWDLSFFSTINHEYIADITQVPSNNITALIITPRKSFGLIIKKEGFKWTVAFSDINAKETSGLNTEIIYNKNIEASLFVPTDQVKNVIMTLDPNTGDILMIAPVYKENLRNNNEYKFIDLKTLKTYQGYVIEAYTDDIIVNKEASGISIGGLDRGLNISPNLKALQNAKTDTK